MPFAAGIAIVLAPIGFLDIGPAAGLGTFILLAGVILAGWIAVQGIILAIRGTT